MCRRMMLLVEPSCKAICHKDTVLERKRHQIQSINGPAASAISFSHSYSHDSLYTRKHAIEFKILESRQQLPFVLRASVLLRQSDQDLQQRQVQHLANTVTLLVTTSLLAAAAF